MISRLVKCCTVTAVFFSVYCAATAFDLHVRHVLLSLATFLALYFTATQFIDQYHAKPNEPPLYSGWIPYLGLALEFGQDHASLLRALSERSKDAPAFTAYIAGQRMTFIKNPLHFNTVLRKGKKLLQFRPVAEKIMKSAFNCTTVDMKSTEYELWEKCSPAQWAMLRGEPLLNLMVKTQQELMQALRDQETKTRASAVANIHESNWHEIDDLYSVVVDLMFQATGRSFFGTLFDDDGDGGEMNQIKTAFHTFDTNFPLLAGGVPSNYIAGVSKAMAHLFSKFQHKTDVDLVNKYKVSEIIQFRQDFLNNHMDHNSQGSFQLGFVWATMANTLPTAFWSLYFVMRDPVARAACREEADRVLGPWLKEQEEQGASKDGSEGGKEALANVLNNMPRLESVVSEALRMCIASITLRQVMQPFDMALGEHSVSLRKHDQVVLAPTLTHYDPDIYDQPTVFQWDRFLMPEEEPDSGKTMDEGSTKKASLSNARRKPVRYKNGKKVPPAIALQPFGGGSTMCPGRHFALAEIKAFVALVLVQWEIDFEEEEEEEGTTSSSSLSFGVNGVPRLEQARAGLGSLPPLKEDKVGCRWRPRTKR